MKIFLRFAVLLSAVSACLAQGARSTGDERLVGTVNRVDTAALELTVNSDAGGELRVVVSPQVSVLRIAPGERDLAKAQRISFSEITQGDRVLIRGTANADRGLTANSIVVISKGDLARKYETERAEWKRRGISGKVSSIDPLRREITLVTSGGPNPVTVVFRLAPDASQKRYRPDSIKFNDAQPSTLADIRIGDLVHTLGDKGADGITEARQIISGSFRTFVAVIVSLDIESRILAVKEAGRDHEIQVRITPDCILRGLTPEVSRRIAGDAPGNESAAAGPKSGAPDIQSLLELMPVVPVERLKAGAALIISAGLNPGPGPIFAFAVLSGAEPLLARSTVAQREFLGSWELNLDPTQP